MSEEIIITNLNQNNISVQDEDSKITNCQLHGDIESLLSEHCDWIKIEEILDE